MFELFGSDRIRASETSREEPSHTCVRIESPRVPDRHAGVRGARRGKDVNFIERPPAEAKRLLAEARSTAIWGSPRTPRSSAQRSRARGGDSVVDRPWSQYLCCLVAGTGGSFRSIPCTSARPSHPQGGPNLRHPARARARTLVERGFTKDYD